MNLLVNLLKAFGIALASLCLLGTARWHLIHYFTSFRAYQLTVPGLIWICLVFFTLALGLVYLPPRGRIYAAGAVLPLVAGALVWMAFKIKEEMRDRKSVV